jgi:hypothetical protein
MTELTDEMLDAKCSLTIVKWEGHINCAYLNNLRIAGGKPWAGGTTVREWKVGLREVIRAFPELREALGFDYLGNRT